MKIPLQFSIFLFLSAITTVGAVGYYAWEWNGWIAALATAIGACSVFVSANGGFGTGRPTTRSDSSEPSGAVPKLGPHWLCAQPGVLLALGLVPLILLVQRLIETQRLDLLVSPWDALNASVFWLAGAAVLVCVLASRWGSELEARILTGATVFVLLSVGLFIFPLGHAYDPILHEATVKHISEFGTISPKPFYYVGYYALILWLHTLTHLSLAGLSAWTVPVLAAILLPIAVPKRGLPLLLLLPLAPWTLSTPQGLANLWVVLTILFAIGTRGSLRRILQGSGFFSTLFLHPIAAIALAIWIAVELATTKRSRSILVSLACLAYPIAFFLLGLLTNHQTQIQFTGAWRDVGQTLLPIAAIFENHFRPLEDFAAAVGALLIPVWVCLGWWFAKRNLELRSLAWTSVALLVNYMFLTLFFRFPFLAQSEQTFFAVRLLPLAALFSLPLMLARLSETPILLPRPQRTTLAIAAALVLVVLGNWYTSYPRHDSYERSHAFPLTQTDLRAVANIAQDANGKPYVVLAHQMTSAAAIRSFGFEGDRNGHFYYPIPTSGPLYELFLQMNETPSAELASEARALTQSNVTYFVVSRAWWQSARVIAQAKTTANRWWSLDDGTVTIFVYESP